MWRLDGATRAILEERGLFQVELVEAEKKAEDGEAQCDFVR